MKTAEEIKEIISSMIGTSAYHTYSSIFVDPPVITDGVLAVAEAAKCFWFLDVIASYQRDDKLDPEFQVWKLVVNEDKSAVVLGSNDTELIIKEEIPVTDFPLDQFKVYLIRGVILLPGEY